MSAYVIYMSLNCLKDEIFVVGPLLSDAKSWFDRAAQSDVSLIYHGDPDGVVSAAFVSAFFAKRFGRPLSKTYWVGTHEFDFKGLSKWILCANTKYVALFDINIIANMQLLLQWRAKGIHALIYDDHDVGHVEIPDNVTYLTPSRLPLRRPLPPSLFATILEGSLQPQHVTCASIAVIGENLAEEYSDLIGAASLPPDQLDEHVRRVVAFYLCREHDREDLSLRFIREILSAPIESLKNKKTLPTALPLDHIRYLVDSDVRANLKNSEQWINKNQGFDFFFKEVKAKTRVVGLVASNLRDASERGISIAYQDFNGRIIVEARKHKNLPDLHLVTLLKALTRDVPVINLGGHPTAAGAAIHTTGQGKFVENVHQWVKGWVDEHET